MGKTLILIGKNIPGKKEKLTIDKSLYCLDRCKELKQFF